MHNTDDPISVEDRSYELPSGEIIQVNHRQRFKASEIIFNPKIVDCSDLGIAAMAFDSIDKCDADLKI